ncbi:MAG: phospholipase D-like domain-containing protein, partial [Candidatus Nitrosocaldus sp.]
YNRALTAQEVNDAYNNGVFASDGLVMYTSMPILLKNDEYYYDLLEHIKIAKKKIYLHVYQLQYTDYDSRPNTLLNELVNAKKRNVDVRVSFDDNSLNLDAIKAFLTQNNIPYKIKPPHAKIVVIDDKIAYVGSANWRVSSLTYNNELTIKTNNIYIISKLNTYLDNIWNTNGRWGYYDDSIYQEEFLTGGYYDAIKNTINNAKDKIRVIMKWWDSYSIDLNHRPSNLARALVDAKNRGVDVKVIVDDTVPSSVRNFLKNNGVHIKLDPKSGQSTHVKSILVDQIVFVGSHNWTEGNLGSGDASIKVYSTITEDFLYYFDNLWNTSNRYP